MSPIHDKQEKSLVCKAKKKSNVFQPYVSIQDRTQNPQNFYGNQAVCNMMRFNSDVYSIEDIININSVKSQNSIENQKHKLKNLTPESQNKTEQLMFETNVFITCGYRPPTHEKEKSKKKPGSHTKGIAIDIRPGSTDFKQTTWKAKNYDRKKTQTIIDTIKKIDPDAKILFNDPKIQGASYWQGHDNHIHVTWSESKNTKPINTELLKNTESIKFDEVTPIIKFIVDKMKENAEGLIVRMIKKLNLTFYVMLSINPKFALDTKLTAYALWTYKVHGGGVWDYKIDIGKRFIRKGIEQPQVWHALAGMAYNYDIWGNIHYGYVGRAAGFTNEELLGGAGIAQIITDLWRQRGEDGKKIIDPRKFQMPEKQQGVSGLKAYDRKEDQAAIQLGIELYENKILDPEKIKKMVMSNDRLNKKQREQSASSR